MFVEIVMNGEKVKMVFVEYVRKMVLDEVREMVPLVAVYLGCHDKIGVQNGVHEIDHIQNYPKDPLLYQLFEDFLALIKLYQNNLSEVSGNCCGTNVYRDKYGNWRSYGYAHLLRKYLCKYRDRKVQT